MSTIFIIAGIMGAYFLGSVCSAIIVCKLLGYADPRTQGSHNPGATNVLRFAGKKAAAFTLVGDVIKGFIPAWLAYWLGAEDWVIASCIVAAFLGHIYPIFFHFKGGKGVATAFGALMGACWMVGLAVLVTWLVMAALFRISSLAALVSATLAPFYVLALGPWNSYWVLTAVTIMVVLLVWRHRSNIVNIVHGREKKIG